MLKDILTPFFKVVAYLFVAFGAFIILLPFFWMLSTALKPPADVLSFPPQLMPRRIYLNNFREVFARTTFGRYLLNSVLVAFIGTIGCLLTSTLGGYVFAKYKFHGKELLFWGLVATMMIPPQIFAFPLYLIMRRLQLVDTYAGLIFPYVIMGFGLLLMRQNIVIIPDDLLDAARIDGCSEFQIYRKLILPTIRNAIGALGIYSFIGIFGAFLWPLIIVNSSKLYTVPLGLVAFQKRYTIEYGPMMAACTIAVIPLAVIYFVFRKRIIESFVLSGMKG